MNLRHDRYSPRPVGHASRLDRPSSQLPNGSRIGQEGIEAAQDRTNNRVDNIMYRMRVVQGHFDYAGEHRRGIKIGTTKTAIERVRRLIGQSIPAQAEYAKELKELAGYEAKLTPNN